MSRPAPAPPQDPRVARSRDAVLCAATQLLLEGGIGAMTVDAVVARSGVAKTTVYRHWAGRDELLVDAFVGLVPDIPAPDPELGFEDALRSFMGTIVDLLADPEWQRTIPALLEAKRHLHDLAELERRLEERQHSVMHDVLDRGRDEGVLPADTDDDEACLQLLGPLLMASLSSALPIDAALGDRLVDLFLASRR
jgi:AcrR family transcriptional regulator